MKRIPVTCLDDLDTCLLEIRKELDEKGSCEVVIKALKESLNEKQRGLYHIWKRAVCEYTGDTEIDFHEQYKISTFFPVYMRDPENHTDLVNAVDAMKSIRQSIDPKHYETIKRVVLKECSHLNATVQNMRDVLKQLESDAISLDVRLPAPPCRECLEGKEKGK